jgi:hypothetical protein
MKYSWSPTNSGSSHKRCNLHPLQNFAYYFILIVFSGEPTVKPCNNRSNCRCSTPTLQSLSKQEQETNNNPVKKHQKAQLQPQDLNPAKLNQTTISNIQRTKKQAPTSRPGMPVKNNIGQIHCTQDCIKKFGGKCIVTHLLTKYFRM